MNSIQKEQILNEYCGNEMQKLKQMCYPKICRIGGISQMDYDDLYSIALEALRDSVERYDDAKHCRFSVFLNGNISRKFSTYVRDRNRIKKSGEAEYDENGNRVFCQVVSLDAMDEDIPDLSEKMDIFSDDEEMEYSLKMQEYLKKLSKVQIKILELIKDGYLKEEVKNLLHIDSALYNDSIVAIRSYHNTKCILSLLRRG